MYNSTKRVPGGSSYADAVFRTTADAKSYAQKMFHRVIERKSFNPHEIQFFATEDFFMLAYQKIPFIVEDFSFVELKRSEGVHAFEEWLSKTIFKVIREK
ncbi:hypothetical protein [Proteiniclasticum ruminis]|uniref:Uncharacterized protein n=1 Tax=Proteiniclasticum ruminis TaxID=398199 RepID=A0A1I5DYM3_9CLOT|nr:hypothetical protein [Proteiniclasticum ruminis]SFO04309.1 hypothetical protein SAMN04488695_1125 [Proteiniclasticum ruminis]